MYRLQVVYEELEFGAN